VRVRAVGRGDHVPLLQRAASPDRNRLLPDRDMQEASEVACSEALLDLLLEAADQHHLPEEVEELLAGERLALLGDSSHERSR
jgi:hypothetical protein